MNYKNSLFSGLSLAFSSLILITLNRVYPDFLKSIVLTLIIPGLISGILFTCLNFGFKADSIRKAIINSIAFIISTVISGVVIISLLAGISKFSTFNDINSSFLVYSIIGLICALTFDLFVSLLNFTKQNILVDFGIVVTITAATTVIGVVENHFENHWEWIHFINSTIFGLFIGIKLASINEMEKAKN